MMAISTTKTRRPRKPPKELRFMAESPFMHSNPALAYYPTTTKKATIRWALGGSRDDARPGLTGEGQRESFGTGNEGFVAAIFDELHASLDLGQHRAGFEVTFRHVLL